MNNNKPARVVTCRGCSQEFERSQANQRYCPTCREARAAAMEALRVKVCNHCGVERDDCKHGICPDCREIARVRSNANYEAAKARKLARFNANGGCTCGKPATCPYSGLCDDCDTKKRNEARRAFREKWRQEAQKQRQEAAPQQDTQSDFMEWFDGLTDEQQVYALGALRSYASSLGAASPESIEFNPEQVDHPEQVRIDAAFASIMEDFEL